MSKRSEAEKSDIVAASGMMSAVWLALRSAVRKLGGTDGAIYKLNEAGSEPLIERIAALIVGKPAEAPAASPSWWNHCLAALIQACNFVSYRNQNITGENFPYREGDLCLKPVTVISIKAYLQKLGRSWLRTEEVTAYLKSLGYRPATLVEFLFWWLLNPAKWSDCLGVALGSVWDGRVPYVFGGGSVRELRLRRTSDVWNELYEFAAVRE